MKKRLVAAIFGIAALAAFAGTCTVVNVSLQSLSGGNETFAGELANSSGVNILEHQFKVSFLDSNGVVVDTQTKDGCLRSLQDGTSDFFAATSSQSASTTNVGLARLANFAEDTNFKIGTVDSSDISVTVTGVSRSTTTLTVTFTVHNNSSTRLNSPVACIVVRDSSNHVLTVLKVTGLPDLTTTTYTSPPQTITVPDNTSLVDHVDVYVDGLSDSSGNPVRPQSDTGNSVTVGTPTATATGTAVPTNTPTGAQMTATAQAGPTQTSVAATAVVATQTAGAGATQTAIVSGTQTATP